MVNRAMKRQLIRLIIKRDGYEAADANNQKYINAIECETSRFYDDMIGEHRYECEDMVISELRKLSQ